MQKEVNRSGKEGVLMQTDIPGLALVHRGKVRDTYRLDERSLLMISTDRVSAFDVVFNEGIPGKGWILNNLSAFWFCKTSHIIDNHFIKVYHGGRGSADDYSIRKALGVYHSGEEGRGRAMFIAKATPLKIEAIVRGYLTGSGYKEYRERGTLWGNRLPEGLKDGSALPSPVFTPTTKAETGHDRPMTGEEVVSLLGKEDAAFVEKKAIELYAFARELVARRGLVLADTKFEFGKWMDGRIMLIDEALTPDSSRYWLSSEYSKGRLVSFDKQFLRDYLETTGWNKTYPPPKLPDKVVAKTAKRYAETYRMIVGQDWTEIRRW